MIVSRLLAAAAMLCLLGAIPADAQLIGGSSASAGAGGAAVGRDNLGQITIVNQTAPPEQLKQLADAVTSLRQLTSEQDSKIATLSATLGASQT